MEQYEVKSNVGLFYLVASEKGLRGLYWKKQDVPVIKKIDPQTPAGQILARAVKQLEEYFAGERTNFDLPLDAQGTEFQKKVWRELARIPYGETCSYSDIARRLNNAKAVRAVGAANGKNPISIIVPCHRVIGSNGKLTGYAGGLIAKTKLLEIEIKRPRD